MSIASRGISAIGKLAAVVLLLAAFLGGMAGVVYMSLSGSEMKVPEIVGKDFIQSQQELAALGLKIKRRADRPSTEKMNTVLEQLPKAGETVKTGQWIYVVVSKAGVEGEAPMSLQKDIEQDDTEKIEEMISDKPKKKANSNTNKKKADTTRDVIANTATSTSNSNDAGDSNKSDANKKESDSDKDTSKPAARPENTPGTSKPSSARQPGETRSKPDSRPN